MDVNNCTDIPDEIELLEFFESEPIESYPNDGFWSYERGDINGALLRLSFNIIEKSIQSSLYLNGDEVMSVSYEGVNKIDIIEEKGVKILKCECGSLISKTTLKVFFEPKLYIEWQSLGA
ncbi:hypothetical protein [Desulfoluna butyratoxydans]|uniref:hypothetical protein n=1 Tax=Desulfoluna butyratoxydans TaxID=231438 RepID=UPI0015D20A32|nr:hypothetical protein [Desulfoluna butyratoxydans]